MASVRWDSPREVSKYKDIDKNEEELIAMCENKRITHRLTPAKKLEIKYIISKNKAGVLQKRLEFT